MYILPSMNVSDVKNSGTEAQQAAVEYFDKNGNGILEASEAANFNGAKIDKTDARLIISSPDGIVDEFENIGVDKGKKYYESGTIPVAVVDTFSAEGYGGKRHGLAVCNMLKKYNSDLAITQFDAHPSQGWGVVARTMSNFLEKHPELEEKIYGNTTTRKIAERIFKNSDTGLYVKSFKNIKSLIDDGVKYKAVNLSSGYGCSYKTINELCADEIGEEITPDNIAGYKTQIKEILKKNSNKNILYDEESTIKISKILELIEAIEAVQIPVYMANTYKQNNDTEETFNLLSFADNTILVEAGREIDGQMKTLSYCSSNSLSIDPKTGERRIEDSSCYDGDAYNQGSTSFSTPIALAKDLKLN